MKEYICKNELKEFLDSMKEYKILTHTDKEEFYKILDAKGYPRFISDKLFDWFDNNFLKNIIESLEMEFKL